MLIQKKGFPEESELVLCTVTNVQSHSVFVRIDEFGISGMIHISEVSPGRIRNIRDYVKEGKLIVCKVLRINKDRGHVDLSLRRVTEGQRRGKINDTKQLQKAEKIVEFVAKKLNKDPIAVYTQVSKALLDEYDSVFHAFMDVVENNVSLAKLGVSADMAEELEKLVRSRLKPETVSVRGTLTISSNASDGIIRLKKALAVAKDFPVEVKYLGAGHFLFAAQAADYKAAEDTLKKSSEAVIEAIEKLGGTGEFAKNAA